METWAILVLVIGLNIITVLSSYFLTKMQVRHSDRRLEKELERAREVDVRNRRWEVRGEPLLKLRAELARMATKGAMMLERITLLKLSPKQPSQEAQIHLHLNTALEDFNTYLGSGELERALFVLDDKEIIDSVESLVGDISIASYETRWAKEVVLPEELDKLFEASRRVEEKVIQTQSLINKRLEKL